ncbi:FkbM family methyltransferase [Afifella aestuarii]|uniref:FkbM family methyltransferase n=1 Tax=Afifella aestuarii TaxID=1909496 RepID=UPI000FE3EFA8|nr:FkbM family methyltransferase [Afifella aestuarii]
MAYSSMHLPTRQFGNAILSVCPQTLLRRYYQWHLSFQAHRHGRGRPVEIIPDAERVIIDDGLRRLALPSLNRVPRYRSGIGARLHLTGEKYAVGTLYFPRESDVVIDIGANVGELTILCADAGATVIAIEPDPRAYACLAQNVRGLDNVRLVSCAMWKGREALKLHLAPDGASSSLIRRPEQKRAFASVEAWPLDALPAVAALPAIDFMKIDAEGVEPEILAGAMRTLKRTRLLAIDMNPAHGRAGAWDKVERALEVMGFQMLEHTDENTIVAANMAFTPVVPQYPASRSTTY